jgi:hypothetical protein
MSMSAFISRRSVIGQLVVLLAILFLGCGQRAAEPGTPGAPGAPGNDPTRVTAPVSTEPGEIELSEPKVTFTKPNMIQFEVRYRFTKGKPDKYYMCDVSFPGTSNHAAKPMESWELKSEGVIKDGIMLSKPPVEKFEIRISESTSPQDGYKPISNVVTGPVQ